jgi:hypothetical protein
MPTDLQPDRLPLLIGSLPLSDHRRAAELVFQTTPDIPLWVQLPVHAWERMIPQFLPGLPGLRTVGDRSWVDTAASDFDDQRVAFYEDYLGATEGRLPLEGSRFCLFGKRARGFEAFMEKLAGAANPPLALKGQVTGPFTFCTGVHDQNGGAIFYHPELRDAAVKLLALKAAWQVRRMGAFGRPVMIFLDEPALAGFGTSGFISVSRDEVAACLSEVVEAVHEAGGLAGVHVCANTDWSLVLGSTADVVSFDAYGFFDRFVLYPELIRRFFEAGRLLAWGIVPTGDAEAIRKETVASLAGQWRQKAAAIEALGVDRRRLEAQSLITPSCGAGSLPLELAEKVLRLTREVSERVRS